jgi:cell division protein FtsB
MNLFLVDIHDIRSQSITSCYILRQREGKTFLAENGFSKGEVIKMSEQQKTISLGELQRQIEQLQEQVQDLTKRVEELEKGPDGGEF